METLLSNPEIRDDMGVRADQFVRINGGALDRVLPFIAG